MSESTNYDGELIIAEWQTTRSGARAGRGFHFQDAVGAWLAAQVAAGSLPETVVVPEGLDDIWLEGKHALHIQVKSRIDRLGSFPVQLASRHLLDGWESHVGQIDGNLNRRFALVLERGVEGHEHLQTLDQSLDESLAPDSAFRIEIARQAARRGMTRDAVTRLLSLAAVVGTDWEKVTSETARHLGAIATVPPSGLAYVARDLRITVAETSDANATAEFAERATLDRTTVVATVDRLIEHMDLDALESAVKDGICEPFDSITSTPVDDRYYEGVSSQPGHVAAGLVVPRPQIVAEVLSGLENEGAVVLTGPSGVGKSAVLWTIPLALPGVLWFRVRHLADVDAPALVRLARAYRATPDTPVGFLVDAAGTGDFRGWGRLRAEAASVPGLLLVATARTEDLMTLGDLSDCATVMVKLDEAAAEAIFNGLIRRGATSVSHWREAFEASHGLTMEFAHLLTKGRRLEDVVSEQVRTRILEGRQREFELLSLVSVADRWSAEIRTSDATRAISASEFDMRQAISRLADEHMIIETNGLLKGLHRLRSAAISRAVHSQPPPDIFTTVSRVLGLVSSSYLHRFVATMLIDQPELANKVIETACDENLDLERMMGYLHGLRLSDSHDLARSWRAIAEQYGIPTSVQPTLFQFAATDIAFPDIDAVPPELEAARRAMTEAEGTAHHTRLVQRLGWANLAAAFATEDDAGNAALLLSTVEESGPGLTESLRELLSAESALAATLRTCSIDELGECLAAARSYDPALAELLIESLGGEDAVLERLRAHDPWVTELDVRIGESGPVGYVRFLHVSDDLQPDAHEHAISLARGFLRCVPRIESVDIQALLPGGHQLELGGLTHGVSRLKRQYDHSSLAVAWTQARLRAAWPLLGETDTERLSAALPLIGEAAQLVREAGTVLVTGRRQVTSQEFARRLSTLHKQANALKPPLGVAEPGDAAIGEQPGTPASDELAALILDFTGNAYQRLADRAKYPSLSAYIADTIIGRHLDSAHNEPWHLLGIDGVPTDLEELESVWRDLHSVVNELAREEADRTKISRSARSGRPETALRRAADTCRRLSRHREQKRREEIRSACREAGFDARIFERDGSRLGDIAAEFAVAIESTSLFEWSETLPHIKTTLEGIRRAGESFLLVPLRRGRPTPALAMKLISDLWPYPELGEWEQSLPSPHPDKLYQAFDAAHKSLQALSGTAQLPSDRQAHDIVTTARERALAMFQDNFKVVLELPRDSITSELLEILSAHADLVQSEFDGTASGRSLAELVVMGSLGLSEESPPEFNALVGGRVFSLEWEIDRQAALQMLGNQPEGATDPGQTD